MKATRRIQPRPRRPDSKIQEERNPKRKDENEKETLNETLDLSGIPLTLKIGNPPTSDPSLPFIVVRGEAQYKRSAQIPFPFSKENI